MEISRDGVSISVIVTGNTWTQTTPQIGYRELFHKYFTGCEYDKRSRLGVARQSGYNSGPVKSHNYFPATAKILVPCISSKFNLNFMYNNCAQAFPCCAATDLSFLGP